MRSRTLALLAALPLVGCYPFISSGTFNESFCALDEDGDGAIKCVVEGGVQEDYDCDDSPDGELSPLRSPDLEEVPYDGVDNDCSGSDELDSDGDGYPGISRADYEALGRDPWPSGLSEEVDCDDQDRATFPGAPDAYYDGVYNDCNRECDYDQDGDEFADRRRGADNDCGLPATDCLDSDDTIFPGAPGEVFYDGEDQDCDGVNDFDPDGDGHAWDGYQDDNNVFLTRYGYTDTITAFDDCYDIDDSGLPSSANPLNPAIINGGVAEAFYDGIDGNCSDITEVVQNDFDRDGDGFLRSQGGDRASFLAYVDRYVNYERHDGENPYKAAFEAEFGVTSGDWAAYYDSHDNDCNDADPNVRPGALEKLGDSIDQDCDGGVDTTPVLFGGYQWEGVGNPQVRATDADFVISAVATTSVDFGSGVQSPRVATFSFPRDADTTTTPTQQPSTSSASSTDVFSPALGMTAFADGYYIGHAFTRTGNTRLLGAVAVDSGGRYSDIAVRNGDRVELSLTYNQMDMRCDSATSSCWVLGCDGTGIQFAEYTDSQASSGFLERRSGDAEVANVDCFIATEASAGVLTLNTIAVGGNVTAWEVDGDFVDVAGVNPFDGFDLDHASSHGDWLVLGNEGTGMTLWRSSSTQRTVLSSRSTDQADVAFIGGTAYVVARGGSAVYLAYGNPSGAMTEVTVPLRDEAGNSYTPTHVAIEAAGNRAMLVVSGTDSGGDDVLGWMILETP